MNLMDLEWEQKGHNVLGYGKDADPYLLMVGKSAKPGRKNLEATPEGVHLVLPTEAAMALAAVISALPALLEAIEEGDPSMVSLSRDMLRALREGKR